MIDEDEKLLNIARWRKRPKTSKPARLGDIASEIMDNRLSPAQTRFDSIAQAWDQLLPAELSKHCKITGAYGSQLKISADSPSYMHELRLCSSEILSQLQQRCPRAKIKKIKIVVG